MAHSVGDVATRSIPVVMMFLTAGLEVVAAAEVLHNDTALNELETGATFEEEGIEPGYAILFPVFTITLGVAIFFVLSRYAKSLPYTAVMFFLGTLMGITAALTENSNHITESLQLWIPINSEVLLLVFLPGLIFKDAFGQNVHLFAFSINQLLIFAFPLVLAGTVLTALVGYYILPFEWSFSLAMTFGSILAATDPVAVAALLEEVGAPPRLKVHVAGESLLNDGSAIVFFSIFSARYFFEFGVADFGEDIDWASGVALFCRKALGGAAIGVAFALGLLATLFILNHRFNREENVVQVTSVFGIAYLNYYVADFVCKTSGVIATVVAGLIVKLLGHAMVNDSKLLEDFATLVEHILNTILFTLGGVVWGAVVADGEKLGIWGAREWGYLVILYVLLTAIRAVLFVVTYPITVRIRLKTNWKETLFQIHGGLRGAVGIALAIALDNEVTHRTESEIGREDTRQVFAMVGGIAFFTLVVNGITAGPLLRKLGLADSTDVRKKIITTNKLRFRAAAIDDMVKLLTQKRFRAVNFALVKHHIPYLADLTRTQLLQAVRKHKDTSPPETYCPPHLEHVLPYLKEDNTESLRGMKEIEMGVEELRALHAESERKTKILQRTKNRKQRAMRFSASNLRFMMEDTGEPLSLKELRLIYISILRGVYEMQIVDGELDDQHLLAVSIDQSLEFAADAVSNGSTLEDWAYLVKIHVPIANLLKRIKASTTARGCLDRLWHKRAQLGLKARTESMFVERSMAFMAAHRKADSIFISEFQDVESELSEAGKHVIEESAAQIVLAEHALTEYDPKIVEQNASHKFCKILLTAGIKYMEKLVRIGLLKESEAEPFVEEMEEHLDHVISCDMEHHPGEMSTEDEEASEARYHDEANGTTPSPSTNLLVNTTIPEEE